MNDINEMPPKCQYCPYWEVCEYPWVCPDMWQQDEEPIQPNCNQLATDTISRQAAIDAIDSVLVEDESCKVWFKLAVKNLPSAQPDEEKISDILYYIYRNTSPHTSAEGVAATKYYIREIYREIFGEEGPGWMKK